MGNRNRWLPGPRYRLADDHAIAQTYLDLSRITGDSTFYAAFRDTADRVISSAPNWTESYQVIDYWWCDALFMSPPALAKLAAATGDHRYLVLMDRLWGETYDLLYDREERLFSRDIRYKIQPDGSGPRERNGEKIFWSRGNGWVLAGTARLIDALPSSFENREFYVGVFREMASRIAELQPANGLWRPSLLDPQSFPSGESSGSGFFCFALAWGINNDVLDRATFLPVVRSSWSALLANLDENGRLGFVQRIGEKPEMISPDDWEVYGTGAFLLAAGEILKLQRGVETGIR
jgi:rhamnogalacturonyl hydrolase YesR